MLCTSSNATASRPHAGQITSNQLPGHRERRPSQPVSPQNHSDDCPPDLKTCYVKTRSGAPARSAHPDQKDTEEPCRERRRGELVVYPKPLGSGKQKPLVIVRTGTYMFGRKIRIHRLNVGLQTAFLY